MTPHLLGWFFQCPPFQHISPIASQVLVELYVVMAFLNIAHIYIWGVTLASITDAVPPGAHSMQDYKTLASLTFPLLLLNKHGLIT